MDDLIKQYREDPTVDEMRALLAPLVARNAAFDGWRDAAVINAAEQAGIDPDIAALAFPDGAVGMIDAWFATIDHEMAERVPADQLATIKIRDRITALVEARLAIVAPDREALRRALTLLAMPQNLPRSLRLGWRSADVMWRLAGDTATDYNHYSKRAILASVYAATLLAFIDDQSEGHEENRAFLARRIDGIMRFEKFKAGLIPGPDQRLSLSRFIGRLRYPSV